MLPLVSFEGGFYVTDVISVRVFSFLLFGKIQ
jgi:hypothetical protein